jgi:hypothetical protein
MKPDYVLRSSFSLFPQFLLDTLAMILSVAGRFPKRIETAQNRRHQGSPRGVFEVYQGFGLGREGDQWVRGGIAEQKGK